VEGDVAHEPLLGGRKLEGPVFPLPIKLNSI